MKRVMKGRAHISREDHNVCFPSREEIAATISDLLLLLQYRNKPLAGEFFSMGDFVFIYSIGI